RKLRGRGDRWLAAELRVHGPVQPDPVSQLDAVDEQARRVAGGGGEGVSFDRSHPEALPLVEAQVADVGGRGGDQDQPHALGCGQVDGGLDEPAPYPLSLAVFAYGHVLDLRLPRVTGAGQLEVADDLVVRGG